MTIDERLANTHFPLPAIREVNMAKHPTGISLGLGELKEFDVDHQIIEAISKSLSGNGTSYTQNGGLPQLCEAVAEAHSGKTGITCTASQVVITIGVQNALYTTIKTLANLGAKRILIPEIHFGVYKKIPSDFNLEVTTYPLTTDFGINLNTLSEILRNDDIIILNTPANPTGRVLTTHELTELANLLNKKLNNGYVISDEIYNELVYDGEASQCFARFFNRTIVVDGISKSAAAAGLRVGWVITPSANLAQAITSNNATIISSPPTANQYGAIPVVKGFTVESINNYNRILKDNCELACSILKQNNISFIKPRGSFYLFPNLQSQLGSDTKTFCIETAKEKNGVVVIPGSAFGAPSYIRISLATNRIEEGMNRLISFLNKRINII